jgi:hypothetical protein
MFERLRVIFLLAVAMLSAVLISPPFASAQPTTKPQPATGAQPAGPESTRVDNAWAVMDITNALNREIEGSKQGTELREKLVLRISECSLMYGGLSTLTANAEAKKGYVKAQLATMDVEGNIAKPLTNEKRLELEQAAQRSVATKLRTVKAEGSKEVAPIIKNCKALNDLNEIKNGVRELSAQ